MVRQELRNRLGPLRALALVFCLTFSVCTPAVAGPIGAVGDVYVGSGDQLGIFQFDGATGDFVGVFASVPGSQMSWHTWGPDGNLYAVGIQSFGNWDVFKFDGNTGDLLGTVKSRHAGDFSVAQGIVFGPDGDFYLADFARQRIFRFDGTTYQRKGMYKGGPGTELGTPHGMVISPAGTLMVVSSGFNRILEFDITNNGLGLIGTFAGPFNAQQAQELSFGPSGDLFVTGGFSGGVMRFDGTDGTFLGNFVPQDVELLTQGIAFDGYGRLLVSSITDPDPNENSRVIAYDAATGAMLGDFFPAGSGGIAGAGSISIKPPAPIVLPLDIKPGSCPNPLNRGSLGLFPVAVLGTTDYDIADIDVSSVVIARVDGVGAWVWPHNSVYEDVGTPFEGEACDCHELGADGIMDLLLKFKTADVVDALELNGMNHGDVVELVVRGMLTDGGSFAAYDCIKTVGMNVHEMRELQPGNLSSGSRDAPAVPR
jgi:DNA-binding beta-propeller fold protein YncE